MSGDARDLIFAAMAVFIDIVLFAVLAVIGWARQRRLEREAYYRHEVEKRLVDTGQATGEWIVKLRGQQERTRWLRRREGLKLGGLITTALGVAGIISLELVDTGEHSFGALGLIPLVVGLAVLLYAYVLHPKPWKSRDNSPTLQPSEPDNM